MDAFYREHDLTLYYPTWSTLQWCTVERLISTCSMTNELKQIFCTDIPIWIYNGYLYLNEQHIRTVNVNLSFTGIRKTHEKGQWTLEGELIHKAAWAGLTEGAVLRAPPHPRLLSPLHPFVSPSLHLQHRQWETSRDHRSRVEKSGGPFFFFIVVLPGTKGEVFVCVHAHKWACVCVFVRRKKNPHMCIYVYLYGRVGRHHY